MKQYLFTLGNVITRKGHRSDCAQVSVRVKIWAQDMEEARSRLAMGQGTIVWQSWGPNSANAPVEVSS